MVDIYNKTSIEGIILTILAIVVILIVFGSMYTFVRAIFFFIFSGSKDENKKKGRNSIRFMIIGIILTIVLLLLFPTIFKAMNVQGYQNYTPQNIFSKAGEIIGRILNLGEIIKDSQLENQYRGNLYYDTNPNNTIDTTTPSSTTNNYSL